MPDTFKGVAVPKAWLELKGARDICGRCREPEGSQIRRFVNLTLCIFCVKSDPSSATIRLEMVW